MEDQKQKKNKKKVLVIGGTGYVGQHLLHSLSTLLNSQYDVAFTHHSTSSPPPQLLHLFPHSSFHVELRSGEGLLDIFQRLGPPDVVVNCAAISVPRECEKDPDVAMSINVPSSLVNWLSDFNDQGRNTLLIHLSTDQVYDGVKSFYKEEDETIPVNTYGKSKVAAEKLISEKCGNFAILRSSIIYGPQTISPISKALPIQWIDGVLSKGEQVQFFHDEFRCPVYVKDVVKVILSLADKWVTERKPLQLLLNVGGPDRVSRVEIAETVALVRGYSTSSIKSVSASSVDRGVKSPTDISMDISKLVSTLNISPTPFKDGVKLTLETSS